MSEIELPQQYRYLDDEKGPRVLTEMLALFGVHEAPGAGENQTILGWAKEVGRSVGMDYQHDAEPWCGLTVAVAVKRAGFVPPDICVRASSWDHFGNEVGHPMLGDILRFQRPGGGHVGLYVGEDDKPVNGVRAYHVLGGNQGDAVSIVRIDRARLVSARRCPYQVTPQNVRQIYVKNNGLASVNES